MGIRWSYRLADKPNPDQRNREPVTTTGDASQNFSGSTGYSGTSTNPTTWVSQSGSSFTTVWGNSTEAGFTNGQLVTNSNLRAFTFAQLKSATHNFRRDMVVGKGGFGKVYKGWLKEKVQPKGIRKTLVAIKTLSSSSAQGVNEWLAEINFLGSLSHQNLVKLLGYCSEEGRFLLVYEFMPKGTLNRSLFGNRSVRPLSWDTRLKIAIGSAQGLYYLHSSVVIHRDLKSSNILLDESYNAKISDFGLAALGAPNHDMFVKGTLGYIDPHYASTGHLTVKSDVYSFGTVLVELLTGLRAVDKKRPVEQHYLVDWIKTHLTSRKKLKNIMDSKLEGKYSLKEAFQVAYLAFRCLQFNPQVRPSIKEVLETLEQIQASRGAKCSINGRNW